MGGNSYIYVIKYELKIIFLIDCDGEYIIHSYRYFGDNYIFLDRLNQKIVIK